MKIVLIAVGTRGDIEPFLAIAELLVKNEQTVICCFPEQFREITKDSGFEFMGLTPKYLKMLESKEGIIAMGGKANLFQKIRAYYVLYKRASCTNKIMCKEQKEIIESEQPDKIIYHIKAIYPVICEALNPNKTVLVSPIPYIVHPVKDHAHIGFKNMGDYLNNLTYKLANWGLLKNLQNATKGLYNKKEITSKKILSALKNMKTIYSISPFLFESSPSWKDNVKILGFHERNKAIKWTPDDSLLQFIEQNKNLVFITFGSMVNADPRGKTDLILRVLNKLNIPAIINLGNGGLVKPKNFMSDTIFFVPNIPYEWLLPKVDYMVHHGGSGTTHMAMKYGCPSLIIPHIIDQFLWNDINNNKGLGPIGVSISKLSEENFEPLLIDLTTTESYRAKAIHASEKITNEDFDSDLYTFLLNAPA